MITELLEACQGVAYRIRTAGALRGCLFTIQDDAKAADSEDEGIEAVPILTLRYDGDKDEVWLLALSSPVFLDQAPIVKILALRRAGLAKLTKQEREALGLKDA